MMWPIDRIHADVRQKINDGVRGFAQSEIGVEDIVVSSDANSFSGYSFAADPFPGPATLTHHLIFQELVLDVARGDGIASDAAFSKQRLLRIVEDYEAHNSNFKKKHNAAATLRAFYLDNGAPGARHLY